MTANNKEQLSALVDGELSSIELDQLLDRLATDETAAKQFMHYQNLSDVMRGYQATATSVDLTARLSVALESEPTYSVESPSKNTNVISFPRKIWRQASGLAIAASFGAMAVLGVMSLQQEQTLPNAQLASLTDGEQPIQTAQSNRWTVSEPEVQDRLNNYLVDHNEYAGASGVFSYARVVSYESE